MIDEKKLLEEITMNERVIAYVILNNKEIDDYSYKLGWNNCAYDTKKKIYKQSKIGEWIPVKEALPKDLEEVLTCDYKGNMHVMYHWHDFEYPFNISPNDIRYYQPIAWMPLPKAYKENEKNER